MYTVIAIIFQLSISKVITQTVNGTFKASSCDVHIAHLFPLDLQTLHSRLP